MIIIQANGAEGDLEEKILAFLRREDIAAERVSLSSRHTRTFPIRESRFPRRTCFPPCGAGTARTP